MAPAGFHRTSSSFYRLITILLAVLLCFVGCDLFHTRDPEPPTQGTSSYQVPDQPEVVLANLKAAIAESNTDNYIRSFADTSVSSQPFLFIPSSDVSSAYASVFRTWDIAEERTYLQNLGKPDNGTPLLTFTNLKQSSSSLDSVVYTMDYQLYYPHHRQKVPQYVQGNMELHLKPNSGRLWYIQTWLDTKTTSDSTWSYLKAVFSAN
jgi:hypothetical protein